MYPEIKSNTHTREGKTMTSEKGFYNLGSPPTLDGLPTVEFGFFTRNVDAYAWIITNDYIEEGEYNAVGTIGPGTADERITDAIKVEGDHRIAFDMYDDDGEKYYSGFLTLDPQYAHSEAVAGPLDDFGTPNAGCTDIRYPDCPDWDCG